VEWQIGHVECDHKGRAVAMGGGGNGFLILETSILFFRP